MSAVSAADMRTHFDRSYMLAPRSGLETMASILTLRIDEDPYAVALAELSGLACNVAVESVPTANPALLGIVGLRGAILPAFDLGVLLGYVRTAVPRWLLLTEAAGGMALAFEHFEAHLRMPSAQLVAGSVFTVAGVSRRVIDIKALATSIRSQNHV